MVTDPAPHSRTGRGVTVAVVDSGIHAAHPHVGGISGGVGIRPDGSTDPDFVDRLGHGTAVAAAIREKAPDVELVAVKVFDRRLSADVNALVGAIEWAIANGVQIVNLSLGTTVVEHEPALREAVAHAARQRVLIVSASEHDGARWLPGCLPGVVAVRLDWTCPRSTYRVSTASDGSRTFYASGFPRDIPGVPPERNLKGVSFAVANMSGFLARAIEGLRDPTFEQAMDLLTRSAERVVAQR